MIEDFNLVVKLLLERFPELHQHVREALGPYYDLEKENPGGYAVFEDVLQDAVLGRLERNRDPAFLTRIFVFFEEMAGSPSQCVTDLLTIGLLDELVRSREGLARAWPYMGERTKRLAATAAAVAGHAKNLPSDKVLRS
jgi:hypothetical protein